MTAYLLLAALGWAVATRGGTSLRDLVVVLVILTAAAVARRPRPWSQRDLVVAGALTVLVGWLLVAGPLRTGLSLESARTPLLVVVAVLSVLAARGLDAEERETVLRGLVVLGCLHAVVAIAEAAMTDTRGLEVTPRADSLLGSANGLGMLLVATSVLTAREVAGSGGIGRRLLVGALLLQGCALLATGSRTSIVVASVLVVAWAALRRDWRLRGPAAGGVVLGGAVLFWRFATEPPEQRLDLWLQAMARIVERPVMGEGPMPAPFAASVPAGRVTTHAHNEILQWGVEYGLVGVALGLLVLAIALRHVRLQQADRWILVAVAVLVVGGLNDFTLRITALTIAVSTLVAVAASEGPSHDRRRPVGTLSPPLRVRSSGEALPRT